jgi:hypothetical protein
MLRYLCFEVFDDVASDDVGIGEIEGFFEERSQWSTLNLATNRA